ncbi:uncharacterized protein LOC134527814 [Bacillus rossius redtenbacheri]|uniref:uncharacterized protein LOC134527814 n=1 Tax=Bacillus rossius redtenbacheri TaxID=93214 RepID=UPI002FDF0766
MVPYIVSDSTAHMNGFSTSSDSSFTKFVKEPEGIVDIDDPSPSTYLSWEESNTAELHLLSSSPITEILGFPDLQAHNGQPNVEINDIQAHRNKSLVPYDDSTSEDDFPKEKNNRGRKRIRCEKKWKKNVRKARRISGKKYVSCKGTVMEAKILKPPCKETCRLKCTQRFDENNRIRIHKEFWAEDRSWDSKRQYISSCVTAKPIRRSRPRDFSRENERTKSNTYSLTIDNKKLVVCKVFFLNTLCISENFVRTAQAKTSEVGMVVADQRGRHVAVNKTPEEIVNDIKRHIRQYPAYQSHYGRERTSKKYLGSHLNISKMYSLYVEECKELGRECGKEWLFRRIFN